MLNFVKKLENQKIYQAAANMLSLQAVAIAASGISTQNARLVAAEHVVVAKVVVVVAVVAVVVVKVVAVVVAVVMAEAGHRPHLFGQ